jgi:uncharacterized protein (DUF2336 family)
MLRDSKALSDADLVSIVEASKDMGKLMAISEREQVSERVSGALVNTNYTPVLTSLLTNEGAKISPQDFTKIATDFANDSVVIEALTQHPALPPAVVGQLITTASAAVAEQLKAKYNISDEDLKEDAGKVRDELMLRLLEGDLDDSEMETLVRQMAQRGTLTPSIMMTALCRGQILFFTMAMATMANVPLSNAVRLVGDRGTHGFSGIYKKSGLPDTMMDAMRIIVRAVQELEGDTSVPGSMLYANRLVERVVHSVGDKEVEYIPYFIALIRNNAHRK